ncbi:DUF6368 family protein [Zavarzinella formosa]|uniref:DUF6368 family protein n=1 Tax=Zavarzinella formosa TaxID=360055 RepID=UPI0003102914|nr:DUF6368 family protein [Zavarzinella formosa]
MAGPSCGVLIADEALDRANTLIESLIVAVGDERHESGLFWVRTTCLIGGDYDGELRPFVCGFEPFCHEPAEVETMAAGFGFRPAHALAVGAMCKQSEDHRLLGEVAAWLAEQLGGVVCAGGPFELPEQMPGRVVSLLCGESVTHVLDGPAMRGWLACPAFHMIK